MNLGQKVVDLVVSIHELELTLLHLPTFLQLLLQVLDLLVLHSLELLKLTSINHGGLLCRSQKDTVPKQLIVALRRKTVAVQKRLILVAKVTLQVFNPLAYGTNLLGHTTDLLVEVCDLPGIATKTTLVTEPPHK
jgi:hypothetical protein